MFSLQRAGMWKRISAFLFDFILGGVAATLFAFLLSGLLGYDGYVDTLEAAYAAGPTRPERALGSAASNALSLAGWCCPSWF